MAQLGKLVKQLLSEKTLLTKQLNRVTAAIGALAGVGEPVALNDRQHTRKSPAKKETRGRARGGMSAAARRATSLRMKKYWAARRKAANKN